MQIQKTDSNNIVPSETKRFKSGLMIFRRDLRLIDNTALLNACSLCDEVLLAFIFDPRQVRNNVYSGNNSLQFLFECLVDLEKQSKDSKAKLFIFYGKQEDVVSSLIDSEDIEAVFLNKDFTPFSIKRDSAMESVCTKKNIAYMAYDDYSLTSMSLRNTQGKPFTVFTHFFNSASNLPVSQPRYVKGNFKISIVGKEDRSIYHDLKKINNDMIAFHGGRKNSSIILNNLHKQANYSTERDIPSLGSTTGLSAYMKFGTHSVREIYMSIKDSLGLDHPLIRQLYWRDFFYYIGYHFPYVLGESFRRKYDSIKWSEKNEHFKAWCEAKTGFPIVDAGMRELNETGYMHNRVRMITASFLVKDLHIDWRMGEKYFAQKLIDYDPLVNNGNWQWSASTGCDSQPYFRIFNPWRQAERFDPECLYIKKWLPELKDLSPKEIHSLYKTNQNIQSQNIKSGQRIISQFADFNYPAPLVEHDIESKLSKAAFASIINN